MNAIGEYADKCVYTMQQDTVGSSCPHCLWFQYCRLPIDQELDHFEMIPTNKTMS